MANSMANRKQIFEHLIGHKASCSSVNMLGPGRWCVWTMRQNRHLVWTGPYMVCKASKNVYFSDSHVSIITSYHAKCRHLTFKKISVLGFQDFSETENLQIWFENRKKYKDAKLLRFWKQIKRKYHEKTSSYVINIWQPKCFQVTKFGHNFLNVSKINLKLGCEP